MERDIKRFLIIGIYLAIFFVLGLMVYFLTKPSSTCFDSKKNQGEQGIDCGGPCQEKCEKILKAQDLVIKEKAFVIGGQGKYDVMAKVYNPNSQFGGSSFSYEFLLKDAQGNILSQKSGKSFILPLESKYLIETNLETSGVPEQVEISIGDSSWKEFFNYEKPELNIYNKRYDLISSGVGFSEAKGVLRNESGFDFELVKINVVLRDESGKPTAFNKTEMRTINSGEERDFRLLWLVNFPGSVQGVEMEAEANVFSSENFITKYTKGELKDFQKK